MNSTKIVDNNWQDSELEKVTDFLKKDSNITAIILKGSILDNTQDYWSDIDLIIVVKNLNNIDWIEKYKEIFTISSSINTFSQVQRIVFEDFSRMDLTLIPETSLNNEELKNEVFTGNVKILYSTNEKLNIQTSSKSVKKLGEVSQDFIDNFWFKTTLAVTKVKRNDLLIATHLLLDLYRDYLVVLMIYRDADLNTNHHRFGGKNNEYVQQMGLTNIETNKDLLIAIGKISSLFDELVKSRNNEYKERYSHFKIFLEKALQED